MKAIIEKHSTGEANVSQRTISYVVFVDGQERGRFAEYSDAEVFAEKIEDLPMTTADARQVFNSAIEQETDPDKIARLELLREYFTSPAFRKSLEQFVWDLNTGAHRAVTIREG